MLLEKSGSICVGGEKAGNMGIITHIKKIFQKRVKSGMKLPINKTWR